MYHHPLYISHLSQRYFPKRLGVAAPIFIPSSWGEHLSDKIFYKSKSYLSQKEILHFLLVKISYYKKISKEDCIDCLAQLSELDIHAGDSSFELRSCLISLSHFQLALYESGTTSRKHLRLAREVLETLLTKKIISAENQSWIIQHIILVNAALDDLLECLRYLEFYYSQHLDDNIRNHFQRKYNAPRSHRLELPLCA